MSEVGSAAAAPDVWDWTLPAERRRGLYVCVSGNTAAGKSSMIDELAARLRRQGYDAIGISERVFHHQYLKLMFSQPGDFAFPIQLSFMLNRHMVLLRNLIELGRVVVMERSHLDDALFVQEHVSTGAITAEQATAYKQLADVLHERIPMPDVLVLMNPSPELSVRRLGIAEQRGDRPSEFPSEQAKIDWVHRWHAMYETLHGQYREAAVPGGQLAETLLISADPEADPAANVATVLPRLLERAEHAGCPQRTDPAS